MMKILQLSHNLIQNNFDEEGFATGLGVDLD